MSLLRHLPLAALLALALLAPAVRSQEPGPPPAPEWWSWKPLVKPPVPAALSGPHASWAQNPIDAFLLKALTDYGLSPSPPADPRTWLRRAALDLTGLPPTAGELDAFARDTAPDARARAVERLLASPHHGERWARHWMDVAHFAETHGHDQDRPRPNAWPYRDWLIRAFNSDLPYARFVAQQLAADALEPGNPDALPALGFLAAGPWDESSLRDIRDDTPDREIARYLDRDDMVTTAMSSFLSTTAHCARCHDHKFDPITMEDYYALQAVFAGVDKAERPYDPDPQVAAARRDLAARQARLRQARAHPGPGPDPWLISPQLQTLAAAWETDARQAAAAWTVLPPASFKTANGSTLTPQPDGSLLAGGPRPDTETYTLTFTTDLATVTALRLEVLPHDSLPHQGPGRQDNGNLHLSEVALTVAPRHSPAAARPVPLRRASADFDQEGWTAAHALDANSRTAWGIYPKVGQPHRIVFEPAEPIASPGGAVLTLVLQQTHGGGHLVGRPRVSVTAAPRPSVTAAPLPDDVAAALAVAAAERTPRHKAMLAAHALEADLARRLAELPPQRLVYAAAADYKPDGSFKPAGKPRPVHMLRRGDIAKPGPAAAPGALSALPGLPARFDLPPGDEAARRAALARWITQPDNPLAWRSIVNRVWHYHFGRGLVDTPNDLGRMGSQPSHPELLDWLAIRFREEGGSLKWLHRVIVTSAAYAQSSAPNPAAQAKDAGNRLLWRMNPGRLDAEGLRDAMLSAAGRLDRALYGPSVQQFVLGPGIHVTPTVDYAAFDVDRPEARRRAVYRFLFRTLPDPFLETLDCPDGSLSAPVRTDSVTALQALALLHNRFVLRQSEHIAARAKAAAPDPAGQLREICRLILARDPTSAEAEAVGAHAGKHGLASACRVLLNSNEFFFVP